MNRSSLLFGIFCCCLMACQKTSLPPPTEALRLLTTLPSSLDETSGLAYVNGQVWTHNDSDGAPTLYQMGLQYTEISHQLELADAENIDWEDMSISNDYLYVGDIGNNYGRRKTFQIYRVNRSQLGETKVEPEKIIFSYPDQPDSVVAGGSTNFDCEALLAMGDSLYLFTKRHEDRWTNVYSIPAEEGASLARERFSFDIGGLVTAVAYDPDHEILAILAYNKESGSGTPVFHPFVWLFYDFEGTRFFEGKQRKVEIEVQAKLEGLCYAERGLFLLSNEASGGMPANLYEMEALKWIK